MDELLKDLEGLGLIEVLDDDYGEDIGVRVSCEACGCRPADAQCIESNCYTATLRYIAKKLTELGYVKVTRCKDCKYLVDDGYGEYSCRCPYPDTRYCAHGKPKEGE